MITIFARASNGPNCPGPVPGSGWTRRPAPETRQSRDAASWLGLAASPTFGLMAWISTNDVQSVMCTSAPGVLPIGGMACMYLLMSIFHLSPWLKLASALSRRPIQSTPQTQGD